MSVSWGMEEPDPLRPLLIGWNCDSGLPRGALCRIAEDPEQVLERMGPSTALAGLDRKVLVRLHERVGAAREAGIREEQRVAQLGGRVVTRRDSDYPQRLFDLALPPPVLAVAGSLPSPGGGVAIVGSRRPSAYGLEVATWFAAELAEAGVAVISGLAVGIDAAAHRAALEAPGATTVAILGCGLDVDYPRPHSRLRSEIRARGCLLTEFPCGAKPEPWRFPVRNRLIAALAQAVVVVEAAPRSGSLVTARLALDLGREVWAVPGRLTDELALGPNSLLEQGARPALSPGRVLEALGLDRSTRAELSPAEPADCSERGRLLERLRQRGPLSLEALAADLDSAPNVVSALLLELELEERVRHLPGGLFEVSRWSG